MIGFENRNDSAAIKTVQINQSMDPVLNFPSKFKPPLGDKNWVWEELLISYWVQIDN